MGANKVKATRAQLLKELRKARKELRAAEADRTRLIAEAQKARDDNPESAYWRDVRSKAEGFCERWRDGGFDGSREDAIEALEQDIDGCGRVIYTARAQECLRYSRNDGAGPEEMGDASMFVTRDGIEWSKLAYFAFLADVRDEIGNNGIDLNDDPPTEEWAESHCEACRRAGHPQCPGVDGCVCCAAGNGS